MKGTWTRAAIGVIALACGGCGQGVHLGGSKSTGGNSGPPPVVPLRVGDGAYARTNSPGLGPNTLTGLTTLPLVSAVSTTLGWASNVGVSQTDLDNLTVPGNPVVALQNLPTANSLYVASVFCFDVSNVNLALYSKFHLKVVLGGGSNPAHGVPPSTGSFYLGVWNRNDHAYDANFINGGAAIAPYDIYTANTKPLDAAVPVTGGITITSCIFVTLVSNDTQTGTTGPFSVTAIRQLTAFVEM